MTIPRCALKKDVASRTIKFIIQMIWYSFSHRPSWMLASTLFDGTCTELRCVVLHYESFMVYLLWGRLFLSVKMYFHLFIHIRCTILCTIYVHSMVHRILRKAGRDESGQIGTGSDGLGQINNVRCWLSVSKSAGRTSRFFAKCPICFGCKDVA